MTTDFAKPTDLSPLGEIAYAVIVAFLREHNVKEDTGDRVFYSPKEWREKGNGYGIESELIVFHEGRSDIGKFFSLDDCYNYAAPGKAGSKGCYDPFETMVAALEKVGLYPQQCTSYYAAIYT